MKSKFGLAAVLFLLCAQVLPAGVITYPIEGSATFTGGIFGTWDFAFGSGPANLQLEQLTIQLPSTLRFDTAPGGFGVLLSQDIGDYQGTDVSTGLYQILPGTGALLDGGQTISFYFDDFTAGESFHFTGDVDYDCSGLGLLRRLACLATASFVTAAQFENATATFTFGGPGFETTEVTTAFQPAGGLRFFSSADFFKAEVTPTPEPATLGVLGIGLLLIGTFVRRRSR